MNIDDRIRVLEYQNYMIKVLANSTFVSISDIEKRRHNKAEIRRLMKKKQRSEKLKRIGI